MNFETDKQTIQDLELLDDRRIERSIFSIFARTSTTGGQEMMLKLFRSPVSDPEFLQCRRAEINFFYTGKCFIKLSSRQVDFIEHYMSIDKVPLHNNLIDAVYNGVMNTISPDGDYWTIRNGIFHTIQLLVSLNSFLADIRKLSLPPTLTEDLTKIEAFLEIKPVKEIIFNLPSTADNLKYSHINGFDHLFRQSKKIQLRELLQVVYKIDVLQTLSLIMKKEGYSLPEYCSGPTSIFEVTECFHPLLPSPVRNSFAFQEESNLCFLTGPNMSGKSTFLKTIGLILYLSHLGFPVPAKKVRLSLFEGLFTTINLADNINFGYSHFYSEVRRVKEVSVKINSRRKLVVIFDELFRGTNVKDAFDASLMIISALANIKGNLFFISTHILEVAENLSRKDKILYRCFESELINNAPVYDFKLKEGISKERIGMLIIRNEQIIEILNEVAEKQNSEANVVIQKDKERNHVV